MEPGHRSNICAISINIIINIISYNGNIITVSITVMVNAKSLASKLSLPTHVPVCSKTSTFGEFPVLANLANKPISECN